MGITGMITAVTKQALSVIIFIVLAILGWKILKKVLHIVVLLIIVAIILWYFGWLF